MADATLGEGAKAGERAQPAAKLGLVACTTLVIGNMIGSGVFLLPATLAPYGWNAVIGWKVSIGGSVMLALSIAVDQSSAALRRWMR